MTADSAATLLISSVRPGIAAIVIQAALSLYLTPFGSRPLQTDLGLGRP